MEGVFPAGQRRVHLQQEGERAAAARARQRPGLRQPRQAEPRGPPAHFARELLAAQPPGRCLLGEAQLHQPGSSHGVLEEAGCVVSAPEECGPRGTGRVTEGGNERRLLEGGANRSLPRQVSTSGDAETGRLFRISGTSEFKVLILDPKAVEAGGTFSALGYKGETLVCKLKMCRFLLRRFCL